MVIGIVGLGLIGASMAKALTEQGHQILGTDTNEQTTKPHRLPYCGSRFCFLFAAANFFGISENIC